MKKILQRDLKIFLISDLAFWPAFQALNFCLVRPQLQPTVVFVMTFYYAIWMSILENREFYRKIWNQRKQGEPVAIMKRRHKNLEDEIQIKNE